MYVIEVRNAGMKGIVTIMRVIMNGHLLQMLQLKLERLKKSVGDDSDGYKNQ